MKQRTEQELEFWRSFQIKQVKMKVSYLISGFLIRHLSYSEEYSFLLFSVLCFNFYFICVLCSHLKATVACPDLTLLATVDGNLSQSVRPAHSPIRPFLGVISAQRPRRSSSHSSSVPLLNLSWEVLLLPSWLQTVSRVTAERWASTSLTVGTMVGLRQSDSVIPARRLPAGLPFLWISPGFPSCPTNTHSW